jgi:MtN3 and saliva related transmembrane protein
LFLAGALYYGDNLDILKNMDYPTISRCVVAVASLFITAGLYHQAYKIWKTRSVRDFVVTIIAAMLINEVAWLNYGIMLAEWPIIFITSINLVPAIAVFVAYLRFGGKR